MANKIQYRRDTAANWTAANPVLSLGEPGYETDTKRRKVGDGTAAWASLPYQFDASLSLSDSRRRFALGRFHRAAAEGGMVGIINYGHSVTEGANAGPGQRWTDVLAANLRAKLQPAGVVGGAGYAAAEWTYPTAQPANWAYTGTTSSSGNGLGLFGKSMTSGATATLTFTGTGIRVMGKSYPGGPTVTVTVDGVAQTAWNLNTAGVVNTNHNALYTGFTAGSHTIVLTFGGTAVFNGGEIHNGDEVIGFVSYNAGHAGGQVTDISNWTAVIPDAVKSLTPSLITIEYGINEYRMNTTPATFDTNLRKAIGMVRAAIPNASVVLISDFEPAPNGTPVAAWSAYKTVMANAAAALNCGLVDLSTVATLGPGGSGMNADMVHPNVAGHTAMANAISAYLMQDITV
jgi:lysophospholipase L1-like esterase